MIREQIMYIVLQRDEDNNTELVGIYSTHSKAQYVVDLCTRQYEQEYYIEEAVLDKLYVEDIIE